jgi:hypothetical protein
MLLQDGSYLTIEVTPFSIAKGRRADEPTFKQGDPHEKQAADNRCGRPRVVIAALHSTRSCFGFQIDVPALELRASRAHARRPVPLDRETERRRISTRGLHLLKFPGTYPF